MTSWADLSLNKHQKWPRSGLNLTAKNKVPLSGGRQEWWRRLAAASVCSLLSSKQSLPSISEPVT